MDHEHKPPEEPDQHAEMAEHQPRLTPRIWVGSLADYVNGDLHGVWLDANREAAAIYADIEAMLASGPAAERGEPAEEWGILDHDEFGGLQIGEYESIEETARLARAVAAHGPAFALWAEAIGHEYAHAAGFEETYIGRFESVSSYAEELVSDLEGQGLLAGVPSWLQAYVHVDCSTLGRDLVLGGDVLSIDDPTGGIHVFHAE